MKTSIELKNVSLSYSSISYHERSLKNLLLSLFKKNENRDCVQDVPALKNLSLKISEGERVGILGHNGAGKSTFLKMLAGLYPISSGSILLKGNVRALLDLSLGFEPDATGKENILYRGLLLGLQPKEILEKRDEIIRFADLGDFINYPIKTYSSGMLVRLAFAISTAVEGEILLLDEVVGAGDAGFIEKARQRIMELINNSQILILASHDFQTLQQICQRGLVFQQGKIVFDGSIEEAIRYYSHEVDSGDCCVGASLSEG